jgi:hypothetical protein
MSLCRPAVVLNFPESRNGRVLSYKFYHNIFENKATADASKYFEKNVIIFGHMVFC